MATSERAAGVRTFTEVEASSLRIPGGPGGGGRLLTQQTFVYRLKIAASPGSSGDIQMHFCHAVLVPEEFDGYDDSQGPKLSSKKQVVALELALPWDGFEGA